MNSLAKELTDKERIETLSREEKNRAAFAAVKDVLSLIDLTKNKNITYTTYSRDSLRTYLKNPASESNQKQLRKLSNYLCNVSHVYKRIINFKAHQVKLKAWTAYPDIPLTEIPDRDSIIQNYERVIKYVRNMDMKSQILKCMLQYWKNGIVFGFTYGNPEDGEFFISLLDPDYCKISSQQYYSGILNFAMDMSFFDSGTNSYYLDVYDPIFKKLYNKYKSDNTQRWAELPIERTFCLKYDLDNLDYPIPPLAPLMESIISLCDLQSIQNVKDELEATKLLYAKINTISGTKDVDDFEIDLDLASNFYAKIKSALPDEIAFALSPMDIKTVDFSTNNANDINIVEKAYENIINSGGGIVLNQNKITNSASFKLALMADCQDSIAVVEQINAWINYYILNNVGETGIVVEFDDTPPYFVDDKIDQLLKVSQYGLPIKAQLSSLINTNPTKERGMSFMEDALGLTVDCWNRPLVSSNTQSGMSENGDGSEGAPKKDDGDLSDEGEETRDQGKNDK